MSLYSDLRAVLTPYANKIKQNESMIKGVTSGAPIIVSSVNDMTDVDRTYVLSTDGYWYYYDGTNWTTGGIYGAVTTDTTLTQSGIPADSSIVGSNITSIKSDISELDAITKIEVKTSGATMHDIGYTATISNILLHTSADSFRYRRPGPAADPVPPQKSPEDSSNVS